MTDLNNNYNKKKSEFSESQHQISDSSHASARASTAPGTARQWYVVYTKPRQEAVALENLERQGYQAYLPRWKVAKRKNSVFESFIEPFFPRDLFIHMNQTRDNWAPIRSTRGVSGIVRFAGQPKPVPNELISMLQRNENNESLQAVSEKSWKPGEEVDVEEGAFAGYRCIFLEARSMDRVRVLLDILGKQTRATLNRNDLALPGASY